MEPLPSGFVLENVPISAGSVMFESYHGSSVDSSWIRSPQPINISSFDTTLFNSGMSSSHLIQTSHHSTSSKSPSIFP
jgi:hypothetical protein